MDVTMSAGRERRGQPTRADLKLPGLSGLAVSRIAERAGLEVATVRSQPHEQSRVLGPG